MPRLDEPLDLFSSGNPDVQVESLYRLRRSTHHAITRFGEAYWAESQRIFGRLYAPPAVAKLPEAQQPRALAADEAARVAGAYLYGLDETATAAAVTLGAQITAVTSRDAELGTSRLVEALPIKPPTDSGILRWASGASYSSDGIPLIACHWGRLPEGIWLSWWADNRVATHHHMAKGGRPREQAAQLLRKAGPLIFDETATTLYTEPRPDLPADDLPPLQAIAQGLALTATVLASWVLLTSPDAARLVTRGPTLAQAAQDRRAGLTPRPATLALGPISIDVNALLKQLDDGDSPPAT